MSEQRIRKAEEAVGKGVSIQFDKGLEGGMHPVSLRTGIISALSQHVAIATLLVGKGLITNEEWEEACAQAMERETLMLEHKLRRDLDDPSVRLAD